MMQNVLEFLPAERKTQKQEVLEWLLNKGSLTRMEAFVEMGICELSSRIGEIERDGWIVPREWMDGRARNGRKWRVTKYLRPERVGD